jgi:hypothetical protein
MGRPKDPNSIRSQRERARAEEERAQQIAQFEQEKEELKQLQQQIDAERQRHEQEKEELKQLQQQLEQERQQQKERERVQQAPEIEDLDQLLNELMTDEKERDQSPPIEEPAKEDPDFGPVEKVEMQTDGSKIKLFSPQELSELLIKGYDLAQQFLLPFAYRRFAFEPGEFAAAKMLLARTKKAVQSSKTTTIDLNDADIELSQQINDYTEFCKAIPFTAQESKLLKIPLEAWLEQTQINLSPGWALLYALGVVSMSRLGPIVVKHQERNEKREAKSLTNQNEDDEQETDYDEPA